MRAAAHKRLEDLAIELRQKAYIAISMDPRSCSLDSSKKIWLANKAIDHIVDGSPIPTFDPDPDRPSNKFMCEMWRIAEEEVQREWRKLRQCK